MLFTWITFKIKAFIYKFRAFKFFYFFKTLDIVIGNHLIIRGGRGKNTFGKNLKILDNCIFECQNNHSKLEIGNNCFFSYGIIMACTTELKLGDNVWIGEYTSIRDSTHTFSINTPIGSLEDIRQSVSIGNNVWIGRGCLIMPGTVVNDNVIIAANSVVKGICQPNSVYGGCPAKLIKNL